MITDDGNNNNNDNDDDNLLANETKHVIDFNVKALHKIENKLFFPLLKQTLSTPKDLPI